MCQSKTNHNHPSNDTMHHHDESHHDRLEDWPHEPASISRRDRLIMRLEHDLRHNLDHASSYGKLAEEAAHLGESEAARMIDIAAEYTTRQNEQLEKALARLKLT